MSTNLRNIAILCLLIPVAVVTWFMRAPETGILVDTGGETAPLGFYLTNAVINGFNDSGLIAYQVSANRIEELPEEDSLAFERFEIQYIDDDDSPWRITAETARSPRDQQLIDLRGVHISNIDSLNGQTTEIDAADFQLQRDQRIVRSEGSVELRVNGNLIRGIGMTADLKNEFIVLESEVRSEIY